LLLTGILDEVVIEYIENTRLVLNIAQVYPARLRKSKTTRLAEQDKLELYIQHLS